MQERSNEPTHVAYADETNYNVGRYRGIALITLRASDERDLSDNLKQIVTMSNITEFKWVDLRSARSRFAAQKMLDFSIQNALDDLLRFDILIWDTEDKRHKVLGRDDIANLQRMYYHLFKNVMNKRCPHESTWILNPDINSAIKWEKLLNFLELANIGECMKKFSEWQSFVKLVSEFRISRIEPKDSKEEPFIQLADLFAGLAAYSYLHYDYYDQWKHSNTRQAKLFETGTCSQIKLSGADKERCRVLDYFNNICKKYKLGVSLKSNKGLKTPDPKNPINFWFYMPQHEADKAPLKEKT
ncbi:MAG: DUF3800 domain-containing protein [Methanothrix sp.]|nr:DUF3800 domain-containing protein [Methanothrix sp.]